MATITCDDVYCDSTVGFKCDKCSKLFCTLHIMKLGEWHFCNTDYKRIRLELQTLVDKAL